MMRPMLRLGGYTPATNVVSYVALSVRSCGSDAICVFSFLFAATTERGPPQFVYGSLNCAARAFTTSPATPLCRNCTPV